MKQARNKKRRYLRSRITQRLIIETAEKVFLAKGYNKTTITQISKQAKVGYGTVYSHFQGKDDLLNKVIDKTMENFYSILNDTRLISNINDLYSAIESRTYATLHIASERPSIFKVLQQALGQSETVFAHWKNILNHFIGIVTKDLIYAKEKGLVNKNLNLALSSKAMILMLESFTWEVVNQNESDISLITQTLTDLFIQGLCNPEALLSLNRTAVRSS